MERRSKRPETRVNMHSFLNSWPEASTVKYFGMEKSKVVGSLEASTPSCSGCQIGGNILAS